MVDKRGDQSIWITISIIIGVVLLVLLIFGFMNVWRTFQGQVDVITDSNSNVDDLRNACDLRCSSKDVYSYCVESREVEVDDNVVAKGSCKTFADGLKSYGFVSCSRVSCDEVDVPFLKDKDGVTLDAGQFNRIFGDGTPVDGVKG